MAGIDMVHVRIAAQRPALTDLLAGQVQVMFADAGSSIEQLDRKTARIGVTTASRSEGGAYPGTPTVAESCRLRGKPLERTRGATGTPPMSSKSSTIKSVRTLPIPISRRTSLIQGSTGSRKHASRPRQAHRRREREWAR